MGMSWTTTTHCKKNASLWTAFKRIVHTVRLNLMILDRISIVTEQLFLYECFLDQVGKAEI